MLHQRLDIDLLYRIHDLEKTNNITISQGGKTWDEYKCKRCGATFRRYNVDNEMVSTTPYYRTARDKDLYCDGTFSELCRTLPGRKIIVIHCHGMGGLFTNLQEGTVHEIVTPPEGFLNDARGVWVMGSSEPVKLLYGEFYFVPIVKLRRKRK